MCCILQWEHLTCNYRRVPEELCVLRQTDGPLQVVKGSAEQRGCKVRLRFIFIDYIQFRLSDGGRRLRLLEVIE